LASLKLKNKPSDGSQQSDGLLFLLILDILIQNITLITNDNPIRHTAGIHIFLFHPADGLQG
jgi:hypothetical protein